METRIFDSVSDEFTVIKTIVYWLFAIALLIISKGTLGYEKQQKEAENLISDQKCAGS
jgi:hypothetical protein